MEIIDLIHLLGYSAPVVSSLLCLALLTVYGVHQRGNKTATNQRLLLVMKLYYLAVGVGWVYMILYRDFPPVYARINTLYYLSLLLVQVLFYHLICMLTVTDDRRRFPPVHYVIPVVLVTVFFVWSQWVPFDVILALVTTRGEIQAGYEAYSLFFTHRFEVRGIYTIVYISLGIMRLLRYRSKISDYSADISRNSLRWLYMLIILSLAIVPLPVASFFFKKQQMMSSFLIVLPMFVIVIQHGILCFNMLTVNYVIIPPEKPSRKTPKNQQINKSTFEAFILQNKPYQNPFLRITDLCIALGTNRSYLSDFINREYGMNFSRYINQQRLNELERLQNDPENQLRNKKELIEQAGFSSYFGWQQFLRKERKLLHR